MDMYLFMKSTLKAFRSVIGWFAVLLLLMFLSCRRPNPYMGQALGSIIPKDREEITRDDLLKLDRRQLAGVFHQLVSPEAREINGEYRAMLLDSGNAFNRFLSMFTLYFIWGTWTHKAFEPLGDRHGHGYNIFQTDLPCAPENIFHALALRIAQVLKLRKTTQVQTVRIIRSTTHVGDSMFDNRTSFHLVYKNYNDFPVSTMHDEVRKVNDTLYLGLGILTVTGGKRNIFPFVLMGPPKKWMGPDMPYTAEVCNE